MLVSKKKKLSKQQDRHSSESLLDSADGVKAPQDDELIQRIERAMLENDAPFNLVDEHLPHEIDNFISARSTVDPSAKAFLPSLSSESVGLDNEFREGDNFSDAASTVPLSTGSRNLKKASATEEDSPHGNMGEPFVRSFASGGVPAHPMTAPKKIKSQNRLDNPCNPTRKGLIFIRMKVLSLSERIRNILISLILFTTRVLA